MDELTICHKRGGWVAGGLILFEGIVSCHQACV